MALLHRRDVLRLAAAAALTASCERAATAPSAQPSAPPSTRPAPTDSGARPLRVRASALADGRSASSLRDATLLVRGGRFVYAGASDAAPRIDGAEVVDASGATIVPALVDCHAHLTGTGGSDYAARLVDPDAVLLDRALANARTLARAGVLGARDVGAIRLMNVRARDAAAALWDVPVIVAAGTWIGRRGRYVTFAVQVDSAGALREAALAQLEAGADLVKIAVDGATGSAPSFSVTELRPVVEAVHARGKKVAAHAQGLGSRVAAEAGVDTVEHGYVIDATTARAMRGVCTLVTTLSVPVAFGNRSELELASESVRVARAAGVRIATGTDFGGAPPRPGDLAFEVELLVRAGVPPHEALAASTWVGGEVLGIDGLGTLAAGAPADFILVDGDPLADPAALRRIRAVYRAGRRIR